MQISNRRSISLAALFVLFGTTATMAAEYCGPTAHSEKYVDLTKPISPERSDGLGVVVSYPDGTSIIVGDTTGGDIVENHDDHITKVDQNGKLIWKKLYQDDGLGFFLDATATSDGGLLVSGNSSVTRIGADGSILWVHSDDRDEPDIYESAFESRDGSFVLVGSTPDPGMDRFLGLMKRISKSGDVIWNRTFDQVFVSFLKTAVESKDGAIYGVGTSGSRMSGGEISGLVKIAPNGKLIWSHQYEAGVNDVLSDLALLDDNTVVAIGTARSNDEERDYLGWILKIDRDGDQVWENSFKTGYITHFPSVNYDSAGNINAIWRLMLPEFHDLKYIECGYIYDELGNSIN